MSQKNSPRKQMSLTGSEKSPMAGCSPAGKQREPQQAQLASRAQVTADSRSHDLTGSQVTPPGILTATLSRSYCYSISRRGLKSRRGKVTLCYPVHTSLRAEISVHSRSKHTWSRLEAVFITEAPSLTSGGVTHAHFCDQPAAKSCYSKGSPLVFSICPRPPAHLALPAL